MVFKKQNINGQLDQIVKYEYKAALDDFYKNKQIWIMKSILIILSLM